MNKLFVVIFLNIALVHLFNVADAQGQSTMPNDEWSDFSSFKNDQPTNTPVNIPNLPDLQTVPTIPSSPSLPTIPPATSGSTSAPALVPPVVPAGSLADKQPVKPSLSSAKEKPLNTLITDPQLLPKTQSAKGASKQIKPVNLKTDNKDIDDIDKILDEMPKDEVDHNLEKKINKILDREEEKEQAIYRPGSKKVRTVYDYRDAIPEKFYLENIPGDDKNTHLPAFTYQKNISQMLFAAVAEENLPAIKTLLKKGADINAQTTEVGFTPLMIAVKMNRANSIKYLITKGANVNLQTKDGRTALHYAALNDLLKVFELLIKSGAKVGIKDKNGKIATDYVNLGQQNKYFLTLAQNVENYNASLLDLVETGNTVGANFLTERGADVNQTNLNGDTPLIIAAKRKDSKMVGLLLAKGADPEAKNNQGNNAYNIAVMNSDFNSLSLIETALISKELTLGLTNRKILNQVQITEAPTEILTNTGKLTTSGNQTKINDSTQKAPTFFDKVKGYLNTESKPSQAENQSPYQNNNSFLGIIKGDKPVNKEFTQAETADDQVDEDTAPEVEKVQVEKTIKANKKKKNSAADMMEEDYHEAVEVKQLEPNESATKNSQQQVNPEATDNKTEKFNLHEAFKSFSSETDALQPAKTSKVVSEKSQLTENLETSSPPPINPANKPISIIPESFYNQPKPSS